MIYALLYFFQGRLIFPASQGPVGPAPKNFSELFIPREDGQYLHAWLALSQTSKDAPSLIFFHGNAGNLLDRRDFVQALHLNLAVNLLIFDYRGYGQSPGNPSESALVQDSLTAIRYLQLHPQINPKQIFYFGRSLGGAIALQASLTIPPRGLIIESSFSSMTEMAKIIYPFLPLPKNLLKYKFESHEFIQKVHVPLLVLHGDQDQFVPLSQGKKLFAQANEPKYFYTIEKADHSDTYIMGGPAYFQNLNHFIKQHVNDE